jgi:hypothetical protein
MSPENVPAQAGLPKTKIEYKQSEDFQEFYANNVQLLSSNWDLELIFGHLDQLQGPNTIVRHSSMTIPWPAAKILLYFLQLHVAGHEAQFGRIIIPKGLIPEISPQMPKGLDISDKQWKIVRKLYEDFIAANPEAAP